MNGLQIAICEDSHDDTKHLLSIIKSLADGAAVFCFSCANTFLKSGPEARFDLVFFDIYMESMSGIDAARILREQDDKCTIVFTTNSRDHALDAYEVYAEQYLLKPVKKDELERIFEKYYKKTKHTREACSVNVRGQLIDIVFDSILYVESFNMNCIVHTKDGVIETGASMTMNVFEQLLQPPRFMRCHKSYIVNLQHVEKVERDFIMKNGDIVHIRRGDLPKCKKFKHELDKWRLENERKKFLADI